MFGPSHAYLHMEMNEEEDNIFLGNGKDIIIHQNKKRLWKNKHLSDLIDDYFDIIFLAVDLCVAVEAFCTRAGRLKSIFNAAFGEEHHPIPVSGEGSALKELMNFRRIAGDPFSEDFEQVYNLVYSHQVLLSERLLAMRRKMDKKFQILKAQRIVKPLWRNLSLMGQREIISSMGMGSYLVIESLKDIRTAVHRLDSDTQSLFLMLDFGMGTGGVDAVRSNVDLYKKGVDALIRSNHDLRELISVCISTLSAMKRRTLGVIINYHPIN